MCLRVNREVFVCLLLAQRSACVFVCAQRGVFVSAQNSVCMFVRAQRSVFMSAQRCVCECTEVCLCVHKCVCVFVSAQMDVCG